PVLDAVLISQDILDLALRATVNTDVHVALGDHVVALRASLRDLLRDEGLDTIVVPFDFDDVAGDLIRKALVERRQRPVED
ncbi:hypothetical protein, partial [Rhizobium leguminosarum]|uniref:hypothetical protein n=1 Tax=Rhizobium leguminosarum TaxID=384 RepID=UPI003F9C9200